MKTQKIQKKLFKILTKMNITCTQYGKRYNNRPYEEIINDICKLFKNGDKK
jgi:hypothetical protein